jgi:hypothetical protein
MHMCKLKYIVNFIMKDVMLEFKIYKEWLISTCLFNSVDLRAIKSADDYIIVDRTPPIAGQVYDGSVLGVDQSFTNVNSSVSSLSYLLK